MARTTKKTNTAAARAVLDVPDECCRGGGLEYISDGKCGVDDTSV